MFLSPCLLLFVSLSVLFVKCLLTLFYFLPLSPSVSLSRLPVMCFWLFVPNSSFYFWFVVWYCCFFWFSPVLFFAFSCYIFGFWIYYTWTSAWGKTQLLLSCLPLCLFLALLCLTVMCSVSQRVLCQNAIKHLYIPADITHYTFLNKCVFNQMTTN